MVRETRNLQLPEPVFEEADGFKVTFQNAAVHQPTRAKPDIDTPQVTPQATPQVTPQVLTVLRAARQLQSREELQKLTGLKDREHFRKTYLKPLLQKGWIEPAIPGNPFSPLQRYRATSTGIALLKKQRK